MSDLNNSFRSLGFDLTVRRSVVVVVALLLLVASPTIVGAAERPLKQYSAADCQAIRGVAEGRTSQSNLDWSTDEFAAVGKKYLAAAREISDKELAAATKLVGKVYVKASKAKTDKAALKVTRAAGESYSRAGSVAFEAYLSCGSVYGDATIEESGDREDIAIDDDVPSGVGPPAADDTGDSGGGYDSGSGGSSGSSGSGISPLPPSPIGSS